MKKSKKLPQNTPNRSHIYSTRTTAFFTAASRTASICALVLAVACSPGESTDKTSSKQPRVAQKYQEHLAQDWQRAEEGKAPSCATVFAHANVALNLDEKANTDDALEAIEACYVHVFGRYITNLLEPVQAGNASCNTVMTSAIQRRAMRTILEGMKVETAPLDQQLNALLRDDLEQWCPQAADVLLQ